MTNNITNFKSFDYKDYDVKNKKKADPIIKRAWDSIKKALSSEELKYAAGLLLTVAILVGKNDKLTTVLKDIVSGRVDFRTLEEFRKMLVDIAKALTASSKEE